jgi:hypothetical protein
MVSVFFPPRSLLVTKPNLHGVEDFYPNEMNRSGS